MLSWGRAARLQGFVRSLFQPCQRASREYKIFPRLRLVGQIAQQVCGMIGDDQRYAAIRVDPAAQRSDRRFGIEQRQRRESSQRNDQLRSDQLELSLEVWRAR